MNDLSVPFSVSVVGCGIYCVYCGIPERYATGYHLSTLSNAKHNCMSVMQNINYQISRIEIIQPTDSTILKKNSKEKNTAFRNWRKSDRKFGGENSFLISLLREFA